MNLVRDKALAGYATVIVVAALAALTVLSVSSHAADVRGYISALSPAVTGLVILLGIRPKAKQAAESAADFTDDQRGEIEAIVIKALTDFDGGKRSHEQGSLK